MSKRRWKLKTGASTLIVDGKKVELKPGQEVECEDYELPESFRGQYEELFPPGAYPVDEEEPDADLPSDNFEVKHVGGGRYDVINTTTKKVVNDERLDRTTAHALAGLKDAMAGDE
jgi:hypothetical protein